MLDGSAPLMTAQNAHGSSLVDMVSSNGRLESDTLARLTARDTNDGLRLKVGTQRRRRPEVDVLDAAVSRKLDVHEHPNAPRKRPGNRNFRGAEQRDIPPAGIASRSAGTSLAAFLGGWQCRKCTAFT